jgi:hypothetical protein
MIPCVLVDGNGLFGETCCFYLRIVNRSTRLGHYSVNIQQHRNKMCRILRTVAIEFDLLLSSLKMLNSSETT